MRKFDTPWTDPRYGGPVSSTSNSKFNACTWSLPSHNPGVVDFYHFKWNSLIPVWQEMEKAADAEASPELVVMSKIALADDSGLAFPGVGQLLWAFRCFVYAKLHPVNSRGIGKSGSAHQVFNQGKVVIGWLLGANIRHWEDVRQSTLHDFRVAIGGYSPAYQEKLLSWWISFFKERSRLPLSAQLKFNPFNGSTGISRDNKRHKYIPDKIVIPVLAGASEWVLKNAGALKDALESASMRLMSDELTVTEKRSRFVYEFGSNETRPKWPADVDGMTELNDLMNRFIGAVAALVLCSTGMRVGELCSLPSDPIIESRTDKSGEYRVYRIMAKSTKFSDTESGHIRGWVIGAVPIDQDYEPLAVIALRKIAELSQIIGSPHLFFYRERDGGPSIKASGLKYKYYPLKGSSICERIKAFVCGRIGDNWIFDADARSWKFSCHQFRKTFVRFVVRIDPGAIDALGEQLGHLGLGMLRDHYYPDDFELQDMIAEERMEQTSRLVMLAMTAPSAGGKMAEQFGESFAALRSKILSSDELQKLVDRIVRLGTLRAFPCAWGVCIYRKADSRCCGSEAGPNPITRSPAVCLGCPNFYVPKTEEFRAWHEMRVSDISEEIASYRKIDDPTGTWAAIIAGLEEDRTASLQYC